MKRTIVSRLKQARYIFPATSRRKQRKFSCFAVFFFEGKRPLMLKKNNFHCTVLKQLSLDGANIY